MDILLQMRKKEPLPSLGWALGTDGKPTTDANEAFYRGAGEGLHLHVRFKNTFPFW